MSHQTQATLPAKDSANNGVLHMAIEMGEKNWKLLFSDGKFKPNGQLKVYQKGVDGNDYVALSEAVGEAKKRFKLGAGALVVSCYEAGQDGFWPHRQLEVLGIVNLSLEKVRELLIKGKIKGEEHDGN